VILRRSWGERVSQERPRYRLNLEVPVNKVISPASNAIPKTLANLSEFGNIDETGEVLQIGALIIKLAQSVVLSIIPLAKNFECVGVIGSCSRRSE